LIECIWRRRLRRHTGGTSGLLDLAQPQVLSGTITGWQVGDVIDFASTSLTSAGISASMLSVTASGGRTFSYQLADQQANTFTTLRSDGNGGTDVTLAVGGPDLGLLLGAGPAGADNSTNSNNPMFAGLALPLSTVVLYDGTTKIGNGQANAQGVWTITANTLPLGTNMITATATDTQGHTTTSPASDILMASGTSFQTSSNGTGNENANFQVASQNDTFTFGGGTVVVTATNGPNAVTGAAARTPSISATARTRSASATATIRSRSATGTIRSRSAAVRIASLSVPALIRSTSAPAAIPLPPAAAATACR
jgi:hypothetical protein